MLLFKLECFMFCNEQDDKHSNNYQDYEYNSAFRSTTPRKGIEKSIWKLQLGSEYQTFEYPNHLNTRLSMCQHVPSSLF